MTLYEKTLKLLNDSGKCTVIPFKVVQFTEDGSRKPSGFSKQLHEHDCGPIVGYHLSIWAQKAINSNSSISFEKTKGGINVYKDF